MDDKLYFLNDKKTKKLIGVRFRDNVYDIDDPNSTEVWTRINADYPDFNNNLLNEMKNNGGLVTEYIKTTKTLESLTKHGLSTRLKAGALGLLAATTVGLAACKEIKKNNAETTKENTAVEEVADDLSNEDVLEVLNQLDEGIQRDSWIKINDFQNYFNNTAAEEFAIEEDGEARLYLTAEQCIALFVRFNAERITPEDMAYIFGSDSSWFTFANMDERFTEAARILNYYYLSATTKSGLDTLFVDESDSKLFSDFEQLVLNYNKDRSDENKNLINESLNNIFLNPSLDDPKTTNAGAASAIGTTMVPILHASKAIDEETLNTLVEINETITCNKLKKYVEEATSIEVMQNDENIAKILEQLPSILDKNNIKSNNMDIDFEARYNKIIAELYGEDYAYGSGSITNDNSGYTTSSSYSKSVSRSEAVATFGEAAVEQAEAEAYAEFEDTYGETNRSQEAYGQGLTAISNSSLYDSAYDYVASNGSKPSTSQFSSIISSVKSNYSGSYQSSYSSGVDAGASNIISNAYNDAMAEYNARQGSSTKVVVEEEYIKEEDVPVVTAAPVVTEAPVATETPVATAAPTPVPATPAPTAAPTPVPATPAPTAAPVVVSTPEPVVEEYYEVHDNYEETIVVEEEYISQEELDGTSYEESYEDYSEESYEETEGYARVR